MTASTSPHRFALGELYRNAQLQSGSEVVRELNLYGDLALTSATPCCRRVVWFNPHNLVWRQTASSDSGVSPWEPKQCPGCKAHYEVLVEGNPHLARTVIWKFVR